MQNTVYMCLFAFSRNFTNRFSVSEFSQDCSGQYFVIRHVFEKVYLLSYGSKSPWPIRLHDSSECSFSFTTWLFGMILIDIPSVSVVLPVVLEMEKETLLLVIVYCISGPLGTFIDDFVLLINELPIQHKILIVDDFNLDQMFPENVTKVDPLI